jgi:2-polyprenyl-6-methoxyphenol hydroxylase-like FAD-dependent oxidoreductase
MFGNSLTSLEQTERRVNVTFRHGLPQTFDLVIEADGLHSITRRLAFGEEHQISALPGWLPCRVHSSELSRPASAHAGHTDVGRTAAIYPVRETGQARVVLLWRSPNLHDYDRHDVASQRRLIRHVFSDMESEVPRLLAELENADDIYLDSISTVVMESWNRGRVTLVGDAGYSQAQLSAEDQVLPL